LFLRSIICDLTSQTLLFLSCFNLSKNLFCTNLPPPLSNPLSLIRSAHFLSPISFNGSAKVTTFLFSPNIFGKKSKFFLVPSLSAVISHKKIEILLKSMHPEHKKNKSGSEKKTLRTSVQQKEDTNTH